MTTTLHFWDKGDASVGIGRNDAQITLQLDGYDAEETADNIQHAKQVLAAALFQIWDNGPVSVLTGEELEKLNADSEPPVHLEEYWKMCTPLKLASA